MAIVGRDFFAPIGKALLIQCASPVQSSVIRAKKKNQKIHLTQRLPAGCGKPMDGLWISSWKLLESFRKIGAITSP